MELTREEIIIANGRSAGKTMMPSLFKELYEQYSTLHKEEVQTGITIEDRVLFIDEMSTLTETQIEYIDKFYNVVEKGFISSDLVCDSIVLLDGDGNKNPVHKNPWYIKSRW